VIRKRNACSANKFIQFHSFSSHASKEEKILALSGTDLSENEKLEKTHLCGDDET
jgi:hypothetical protein